MNGYSLKLHLIALNKYLQSKGYIVIDAMCSKSFDFVAITPNGKLDFIYLDIDNYIPIYSQLENDVNKWFIDNPAFKMPYQYKVYIVSLKADNRAKIKCVNL